MKPVHFSLLLLFPLLIFLWSCRTPSLSSGKSVNPSSSDSWYAYGGDAGGNRYVPQAQINRDNVQSLKVAWTYRTGEMGQNSRIKHKLTFEATPIHANGMLYLSTAYGKVLAIHPSTGEEIWSYDPQIDRQVGFSELTSRGVSMWNDSEKAAGAPCQRCILTGTIDARLIKLDALTGKPCEGFGNSGTVNLHNGVYAPSPGDHQVTSPPAIINDVIVVGSSIGDNWNADTGHGAVRAFDAHTGQMLWSWDPLGASRKEFKGPVGAANAWSIISADPERDLVFVPTGSASPDFYGGLRPGDNRYANSLVALRASTGELVWHFQTVHHDLWDYDIAAQPALVEIQKNGQRIPAVVQATKTGNLFALHRETGEPIYPIEERPVPKSDIPGEYTSPTQPFSTLPNLMGSDLQAKEFNWTLDQAEREQLFPILKNARYEGIFTPPSVEGTVMYPGNGSGVNWGSVAFDPEKQLLIANTCRYATYVELFPRSSYPTMRSNSEGFEVSRQEDTPYGMRRVTLIKDMGMLLNTPPWGTLAAVNLSTGKLEWEIELGKSEAVPYGLPNAGGSMITKGGLIFIASTFDKQFRAFDSGTGKQVWQTELPLCGIATPMSYVDEKGKQFIVIAAGGHGKIGLETGDYVVAFALPE